MKSSAFLSICGGILATASPLLQARKLYTKTDVVVEWVTVTVTEGDSSTVFQRPKAHHTPTTITIIPAPSTTLVAPPPPATTSSTSQAVVQPPPQPTPEPSPEPSTQAAPVVQSPPSVVHVAKVSTSAAPPSAPAKTSSASVAQPSDFQSTALYHHNVHRFNHSAGALEWSDEHAQYAETLAKTCVFEHNTKIGGGGYGQNLAMWGSTGEPEALGATKSVARAASNGWYNGEINLFPSSEYGKATPDMTHFEDWGHFSQLVWKGTKKVGCASVFCQPGTLSSMGSWYTVCNYYPAGNVGGAYGDNVEPPQGQSTVTAA